MGWLNVRASLSTAPWSTSQMLLLDEPLSNLDAKLRVEMRIHIQRIIKQLTGQGPGEGAAQWLDRWRRMQCLRDQSIAGGTSAPNVRAQSL